MIAPFTLTESDYRNFCKVVSKRVRQRQADKMSLASISWLLVVVILVLGLIAEPFKSGFNHFHWPTAILTGSFFLVFILLFLYLVKRDQNAAMPKKEGCILGVREFEITDEGFAESTVIGKSFVKWSAVEEIIEDSEGCYLFIDTILACIIPASAFSSEAEKRAFIDMVSERTGLSVKELR